MASNAAALLANYLSTGADINFFTQQSVYWTNKQEANARKLERHQKYEAKWENAFDVCFFTIFVLLVSRTPECQRQGNWNDCQGSGQLDCYSLV